MKTEWKLLWNQHLSGVERLGRRLKVEPLWYLWGHPMAMAGVPVGAHAHAHAHVHLPAAERCTFPQQSPPSPNQR